MSVSRICSAFGSPNGLHRLLFVSIVHWIHPCLPLMLQCMSEVRRLEDVRAQQMVDLVNSKGAELQTMCAESHVAEPSGLVEALAAVNCEDRNPGAAAELLAKLLHMLAEVQVCWQRM